MRYMRKHVIAGNWKMHKTEKEIKQFMDNLHLEHDQEKIEAVICAPALYVKDMAERAKGSSLHIGAQTMHFEESGAFTGEISAPMLTDIGASHVIIGHSERRMYFGETDESVQKKTAQALAHNLTPIVCVGESLEQRETGETNAFVGSQVTQALEGLSNEQIAQVIIAYEPIWAIGTGKTASSADANEVCAHIRSVVSELSDAETANQVIIQYGGSVKPDNIKELLEQSDIDGALVGGASLEADSFQALIEASNA